MGLHITNEEAERNVRALAKATGEPICEAVNKAAIERLRLVSRRKDDPKMMEEVYAILRRIDKLPRLDRRSANEIIGYDENGLPS